MSPIPIPVVPVVVTSPGGRDMKKGPQIEGWPALSPVVRS